MSIYSLGFEDYVYRILCYQNFLELAQLKIKEIRSFLEKKILTKKFFDNFSKNYINNMV